MEQNTAIAKHILIADDEEAIRESLLLILEEEGFCCTAVPDGVTAIELVRSYPFDLIILDLLLPKKKGVQLLRDVKMYSPHTPILILSSYYDVEMATSAIRQGATRYLLKPMDFEEVLTIVNQLLSDSPLFN